MLEWGIFSLNWFLPETLKSFDWENFIFLYFIPLVPFIFILRWLIHFKFRQKLDVALPKKSFISSPIVYLRFFPPILIMLSLGLILVSLARPQKTNEQVEQWTEGIDIMLALDISQSMQIEDFKPNRLEAAKEVAKNFIAGRFQDRIGMVIFSGEAISYAPLTTDYDLLNELIGEINFDMIEKGGTAIGSAIAVGINRMRDSDSKSKVLILLSDGESNAGSIDPITAANLAFAYDVKMYTIGIGKEGRVPYGKDPFGRTNYIDNSLDESTLKEIAKIGKGEFFRAANNQALDKIFKRIDKYEKAEIKETRYKDTTDFYQIYLTFAIMFFLMWLFTKSTFLTNVLED